MSLSQKSRGVESNRPKLRLVEPPHPSQPFTEEQSIAAVGSGYSPLAKRQEAYFAGQRDGEAGEAERIWFPSAELRYIYEQGRQIGYQSRASKAGETAALCNCPRELPEEIDPAFAPEFFAGWDRGRLVFDQQVSDLGEAHDLLRWLHSN